MPKKTAPRRRTQVKDLPRKQKKLTRDEQKNVKGGIIAVLIGKTDGSKNITDGTSNTVLPTNKS